MLPATTRRVSLQTADAVNDRIRRDTEQRVARLVTDPSGIDARLRELEQEWDIERALEANASILALAGTVLAASGDRRWLILPGVVTAFLLQHAVQGWCPPLPVLRRLGFRTATEIDEERYALKVLRGDLADIPVGDHGWSPRMRARQLLRAASR